MASHPVPFDRIAAFYDESRGGEDRGRRFARALARVLDPAEPVLEIGVGTGLVALGLKEAGYSVAGIDLSLPMLRRAFARIGASVACADATRLPAGDASIAQAVSVWVLHVAPAQEVVAEAARVLGPGGRYVVVSSVVASDVAGDDTTAILDELMGALDPDWVQGRYDSREAVEAFASPFGLQVDAWDVIENPSAHVPAEIVRRIESRAYSRLVGLDEERWARLVVPALERLRALPDQDRPRPLVGRHELTVLRKPA